MVVEVEKKYNELGSNEGITDSDLYDDMLIAFENKVSVFQNTPNISRENSNASLIFESSLFKGFKSLVRRTSDIIPISTQTENTNWGPLTTPRAMSIFFQYSQSTSLVPTELNILCEKLRSGITIMKLTRNKTKIRTLTLLGIDSIVWKEGKKKMDIDTIKDIRIGDLARNYREEYGISNKFSNSWITVIYEVSNKLKALHVIANNPDDFNTIFKCLSGLVKYRYEVMESIAVPGNEKFANIHWHSSVSMKKEDEDKDTLSFEDVKKICEKFHIYCSSDHLHTFFKSADLNNNGLLNFKEFQIFVQLLKKRDEINELWNEIVHNNDYYITFKQFQNFILNVQKEVMTTTEIEDIFNNHKNIKYNKVSKANFFKYVSSSPYLEEYIEDYSKPLNHYFIASSHNTYLLGKQYGETPSVEGYIRVLQQGCRCIEIDIWDDETGPVICHGVLTSSIPLVNVVNVIRKYAFITSPYPLIISLEVNCNRINQLIVSSIFKEILGDVLIYESSFSTHILSPEQLKHKIIVKVKKTKNLSSHQPASSSELKFSEISTYYDTDESLYEVERDVSSVQSSGSMTSQSSSSSIKTRIKRLKLKKEIYIDKELLDICGIHGLKFRNLSLPESKTLTHCFSLNEKKFQSMYKDQSLQLSLNKHNRKYLMRIYPHAYRYNSSNFNPIPFWQTGVQMVATNWQTNDLGQQLNEAFFNLSDEKISQSHSGYKLKPPHLIPTVSKGNEISIIEKNLKNKPVNFKLNVLSAQLLPKPKEVHQHGIIISPYVIVEIFCDENAINTLTVKNGSVINKTKAQTNICNKNGFNPIWKSELSASINNSDFTFIRFTVKTESIVLARCCLKLDSIKQGYRYIPLYDTKGEKYIFSSLFICTYRN